jgi:acetyl esterase/lipase
MLDRIDPELLEGLKKLQAAMPLGANLADDLPAARAAAAARNAVLFSVHEMPENVTQEILTITCAQGHEIDLRMMRPRALGTTPRPLVYWMHGGGYVLGSAEQDDALMAKFAHELGCIGVSVDYRLAPETPYPGPHEDCFEGLMHLVNNAEKYHIDTARIVIGGASAGGGLAAGLALRVRDEAAITLAGQALLYPMIDDRNVIQPDAQHENTPVWSREANLFGWTCFLGQQPGGDGVDAYGAAARAADLAGLPPTYLPVGDLDLFLDEDILYAHRLSQAGVACELHVFPGAIHGFNGFMPEARMSRICNQELADFVARMVA